MNRKTILGIGATLATLALAAGTSYKLTINGTATGQNAIVVNGQTDIPLAALRKAGANSSLAAGTLSLSLPGAPGGANQRTWLEGCVGEQLFNGALRLRVLKLEPVTVEGLSAWQVNLEVKNGTPKTHTLADKGQNLSGKL